MPRSGHAPELRTFATCWNDGKFFEAHEALEPLWGRTRDAGQQGLIQLAVALHHMRHGNMRGAGRMVERAIAHLKDPSRGSCPFDLGSILEYAGRLIRHLDRDPVDQLISERPYLKM